MSGDWAPPGGEPPRLVLPPAGWYPDPERWGVPRWWDGTAWAAVASWSAPAPVRPGLFGRLSAWLAGPAVPPLLAVAGVVTAVGWVGGRGNCRGRGGAGGSPDAACRGRGRVSHCADGSRRRGLGRPRSPVPSAGRAGEPGDLYGPGVASVGSRGGARRGASSAAAPRGQLLRVSNTTRCLAAGTPRWPGIRVAAAPGRMVPYRCHMADCRCLLVADIRVRRVATAILGLVRCRDYGLWPAVSRAGMDDTSDLLVTCGLQAAGPHPRRGQHHA